MRLSLPNFLMTRRSTTTERCAPCSPAITRVEERAERRPAFFTSAFTDSIGNPISKYLPLNISDTMTSVGHAVGQPPSLSPWVGFAVVCAYAFGALLVGGVLMARRDA